jgi:hypothetical protein
VPDGGETAQSRKGSAVRPAHPADLIGNANHLMRVDPLRTTTHETIREVTHAVPVLDADDHDERVVEYRSREYPLHHGGGHAA